MNFSRLQEVRDVPRADQAGPARPIGGARLPNFWEKERAGAGATALVALLGILFVAAHWLTRSRYLFDLDSILYTRALAHFDLRLTQPALPGYYLYIQLGRLAHVFIGDADTALVVLSIFFGALVVGAAYLLGRDLFDGRTGQIAGLLALSGPIYWYQSSFASPRIAEGFFATAIVWVGARLRRSNDLRFFWLLPPLLAVAGGVRQQTLLYLIPFSLWATLKVPWRQWVLGAAIFTAGCLAWGIPTLVGAGGLAEYRALSNAQWQEFVVGETGVLYGQTVLEMLHRLEISVGQIVLYGLYTCLPAPIILLAAVRRGLRPRDIALSFPGQALLFATVPALGFFAFIHIQQIGHFMAVAPFLTLALARVLANYHERPGFRIAVGLVVLVNLAFVVFAPARLIDGRLGTPTLATIRDRDKFIASGIAAIRSNPPGQTLVITSPLSYGFIEEYAPEYHYYLIPGLLSPNARAGHSPNQQVLINGLRSVSDTLRRGPGDVAAPEQARYFVLLSYETDLTRVVDPADHLERPDPGVPLLAIVKTASATDIRFQPGHLVLQEAPSGTAR